MLGFMLVTAFISMWITNTATTAMMTPIMEAVLKELDNEYLADALEEDEDEVNALGDANYNDASSSDNLKMLNMSEEERGDLQKNHAAESQMVELTELSSPPSRSSSTKALVSR